MHAPGASRPHDAALELRLLHSHDDYAQCVRLQRETWGEHFNEVVPATILKITNRVGGVVAGAFLDHRLVGFVFGLTGLEAGRLVHWSHMLAVSPDARDRGLGRQLKLFQRDLLLDRGVTTIFWSFDPLVARNAHLNLNTLRVRVVEYVVDMYPSTTSDLHRYGTDRFVVAWDIAPSTPVSASPTAAAPLAPAPTSPPLPDVVFDAVSRTGRETERATGNGTTRVHVEVPGDIEAIAATRPERALEWRDRTRRAFTEWLGRGWEVVGFEHGGGRYWYALAAPGDAATPASSAGTDQPIPQEP